MKIKTLSILVIIALMFSLPALASEEEVVATVNGEEITRDQLNSQASKDMLIQRVSQVDPDLASILDSSEAGEEVLEEYQKAKLDGIIEEVLLEQEIENQGINISREEKTEIFEQQKAQLESQYEKEQIQMLLRQQGFNSLEEYGDWFVNSNNMEINQLLEEEVRSKIDVTEDEARTYYEDNQDSFKNEEGTVTPFEDVKEQITTTLSQQKQQQAVQDYLSSLRDKADIEKSL